MSSMSSFQTLNSCLVLGKLTQVSLNGHTENDGWNNKVSLGNLDLWIVNGVVSMARNVQTNRFVSIANAQSLLNQVMFSCNLFEGMEYPILLEEVE